MAIDYHEVGQRIAARRRSLGLRQAQVCERCGINSSYLSNIERAVSIPSLEIFMRICDALDATPIVIGERSSSGSLEAGIVYSRFNISIISNDTLADLLLEDAPPFIFAAPGGLYVKLDSDMLRAAREERGISLGTLAETAGVSRRTIQMYEGGMSAMIDAAVRLEEYLDAPIIEPVNPF